MAIGSVNADSKELLCQRNIPRPDTKKIFPAEDYDLPRTLASGQAFRWRHTPEGWIGVIGRHWVRLSQGPSGIVAYTAEPVIDWSWLTEYLQVEVDLKPILRTFPKDEPLRAATKICCGLRLLRQDPWECLASFILSSTKQISQIQQIISSLSRCFGEPLPTPPGFEPAFAFPTATRLAETTEAELRACKMGFRAPYLLAVARQIATNQFNLVSLRSMPVDFARQKLMELPGVGRKIADCVLLFAYGFQSAFPIDVWVARALRQLYFPRQRPGLKKLQGFATTYFGPNAGYAQQYLFHYVRTKCASGAIKRSLSSLVPVKRSSAAAKLKQSS